MATTGMQLTVDAFGPSYRYINPLQVLFGQLQVPKISIEYLAANLQRGADRITGMGFNASVFNLATYHSRGVQTLDEFQRCNVPDASCGSDAIGYGRAVLDSMREAFELLFSFEPFGAYGRYLPYNQDEAQLFTTPPPDLPYYLPTSLKDN
jgi:hypothetical protein